MLKFLATTENTKQIRSENSSYNSGKENTGVKLLFATLSKEFDTSRVVLFLIKERDFKKRSAIDWKRVILDWEDGQPKLPNGPGKKTL